MPRQPRLHLPGYPLHVIQRGHNRAPCFRCQADYRFYLFYLAEALREHDCALHAYVLMTNHVHLLLSAGEPDQLAEVFESLGRRYVPYFNRKYSCTGTLWEGRYKSSIIDSDEYLWKCHQYVELNPVRAGMVAGPELYLWSSFGANALGQHDPLVTPHSMYADLGVDVAKRCAAYARMFDRELPAESAAQIRAALRRGLPLGGEAFIDRVNSASGRRSAIRPRGRPPKGK